jgi:glycogen synthase
MHVLMTADTVGGVWTYTRELVSGLIRRGHRITLVSLGKLPGTAQIAWMHNLPHLDYRPTRYALEWMQDSAADIALSTKYLEQLIGEIKPDLLHFNQYAYGATNTCLPKVVVAHSDVLSWWVAVKGEQAPATEGMRLYREIVSRGLAEADIIIAPSHWMMANLRTYYQPSIHGQVIYNGRCACRFDPNAGKRHQVVSIGRVWDQAKQVSLLTKRTSTIPVLIVGSEEHPDKALRAYHTAGVPAGITFCGPRSEEEIRTLLAQASMYAACSCYEPFGLAPVEAALSRCALIANDVPSFRELWGDSAFYFRTNDADSLREAICRLTDDVELCQQYAESAYRHALRNFQAEQMINAYEQLYGALVAQEAAA